MKSRLFSRILYMCILFLGFVVLAFSQQLNPPQTPYTVVYWFNLPPPGSGYNGPASNGTIGFNNPYNGSGHTDEIFHTMYRFDLTPIPTNYIITSAKLNAWVTGAVALDDGLGNPFKFVVHLTPLSTDPANLDKVTIFDDAVSGTNVTSQKYTDTAKNVDVTSLVQSCVSQHFICFGGYSSYEGDVATSQAILHITLNITYSPPISVTVYQSFSTSRSTGGTIGHWEGGPNFVQYSVPATFQLGGGTSTFLGTQSYQYNTDNYSNEKYYEWYKGGTVEPDVLNHHQFTVGVGFPGTLKSQFWPIVSGPSVCVNVLEGGSLTSPTVQFADPWFINYPDPLYNGNLRNQGISAPPITRSAPFTPDLSTPYDGGYTYKGVFLGQNPTFDPQKPIYSVNAPSMQSLTINGQNYASVFQNWTASSASVSQPTSATTPVVFTGASGFVTANYKGVHISSNASAFSNSSQRKLVRTYNGWLHQVYESIGHVWYEVSTDGGTTWTLQGLIPGGTPGPLDIGGGKCPSIDYGHNYDSSSIAIVFQQVSGTTYTIMLTTYIINPDNGQWIREYYPTPVVTEPAGGDPYATTNANPNIAWGGDGHGLLTWERKSRAGNYTPGINYLIGQLDRYGLHDWRYVDSTIHTTDRNSVNATISSYHYPNGAQYFDIAWEQDVNSTKSYVIHSYLDSLPGNQSFRQDILVADTLSNSSFKKNYNPSIVDPPDGNSVQCSWIGDVDGSGTWMNVSALERTIGSTTIQRNSAGVQSVSMNTDNASNYYVAWSQNINNGTWSNRVWGNVAVNSLNTSGQAVQLCNGRVNSKMVVSSFYNSALPYYFQTSNSIGNLQKTDANSGGRGRGVAVEKGDVGFYYSIGDLALDGNTLDFIAANKKTNYDSLAAINNVILSQPFTLTNNSVLTFSESSGASDTSAAGKALGAKGNLSFTIQLVDAASGSVIGTARQLNLGASNLQA